MRKAFFLTLITLLCFSNWGFSQENTGFVKMNGRQLVVDFDGDETYEPFFIKGIGYSPTPAGHFQATEEFWSGDCKYIGPDPLQYPELRFTHDSPDGEYSCAGDGTRTVYTNLSMLDRDFSNIQAMNANTIRIWDYPTVELLQKANEYNIKIIMGIWINHYTDFTFSGAQGEAEKQSILDNILTTVNQFKNDPAVLIWALGNENNLAFCDLCNPTGTCNREEQSIAFHHFMNEIALAIKEAEGSTAHPVMIVYAELSNDLLTHHEKIPEVDIIGVNSYRGENFDGGDGEPNLFDEFNFHLPNKSLVLTEFGVDAWNVNGFDDNPENGVEDQISQADWVVSQWQDIVSHAVKYGGSANGGVVFNYTDEWNKNSKPDAIDPCYNSSDWSPSIATHDHNFFENYKLHGVGNMPDDRVNQEWFGIMSIEKHPTDPDGLDILTPRLAYNALQEQFAAQLEETPAQLTSPLNEHLINTSSLTLEWSPGQGVEMYRITVASTEEIISNPPWANIFVSVYDKSISSAQIPYIPLKGQPIFIRLWSKINGIWEYQQYQFDTISGAQLNSPTPGTPLSSTTTFQWNDAPEASAYILTLATSLEILQSSPWNDIHMSFHLAGTNEVEVLNIPQNGQPVYARLWTQIDGQWIFEYYGFPTN